MSTLNDVKLECKLISAGTRLLGISSLATTQPPELLIILDRVEMLLSEVRQSPSMSMKDALRSSMKALISDQLLKHSDIDVKVSVASCMSELTRITAPHAPYDDDVQIKDIFKVTIMALEMLSSEDTRSYYKAVRILGNMTNVRACVLTVDLECHEFIAQMFKLFLSTVRYPHPIVVVTQMEAIMTHTLKESEEISDELLSILLTSVNRKYLLGMKIMMNCAVRLQHFLPEMVRSRMVNFDDYSTIVAAICRNSPQAKQVDHEQDSVGA